MPSLNACAPERTFHHYQDVDIYRSGDARKSLEESLRKLKTDYIDLLLVHQPFGDYYGTYHVMEEAYRAGKVRAIGVSNFYPDRFVDLAEMWR